MLGIWDVEDVGCWGCGMLKMWDVGDVEYSGCRMFGLWDGGDVECSGCGMLIYKMPAQLAIFFLWLCYDIHDISLKATF